MNIVRKALVRLSGTLSLPSDVVAGLPRMEVMGKHEFSVEPHKGLLFYDTKRIGLNTSVGTVCVIGENLTMRSMNSERIVIHGRITAVELKGNAVE